MHVQDRRQTTLLRQNVLAVEKHDRSRDVLNEEWPAVLSDADESLALAIIVPT